MPIPATIRGHQAVFKIYKDGEEQVIDSITRVSIREESQLTRHSYVGDRNTQSDKTHMGWSGSFEMECRNALIEELLDEVITGNLNGVNRPDYTFQITEVYSDGSRSSHIYTDCVFSYGREQGGMDSKVTKSIDFQASRRVRL